MKTRCLASLCAATLSLSLSLGAQAAPAPVATPKAPVATPKAQVPYQKLVAKLSNNQLTVIKVIPGVANLVGLVAQDKAGGPQIILYADKQGRYALYGSVFNTQGVNIAAQAQATYVVPAIATQAIADLNTLTFIQDGESGPTLNVIIDPNCIWCNRLFKDLRPLIDKGLIQVRWFLVGIIKADSLSKSAAILAAKDPLAALKQDESRFDEKTEEGGIAPLTNIPNAIGTNLKKTASIMNKYGFTGTPVILFKNAKGHAAYTAGYPRDINAFIESNFSIKTQKEKASTPQK